MSIESVSGNQAIFLDDLLVKTSRTFALSIPALPEPTRTEVSVAYLLFRIADTLEDATLWTPKKMIDQLHQLIDLLDKPDQDQARRLAEGWLGDPPLEHAGYLELLGELPGVMNACQGLATSANELVRTHTRRTAEQMARFVERCRERSDLQLSNLADLKKYCYAVAGIVGEMLTELFLLDRPNLADIASELRNRASTFGEALQLVNILKDSSGDAVEGRRYLPRDVNAGQVFALARSDLESAKQYVNLLRQAGAERGIVEFCALPVLLAWATLGRVEREGSGAKLTRPEVREIVIGLGEALDRGLPVIHALER